MTRRSNSEMWDVCTSVEGESTRNRASREFTIWHRMCLRCYDKRQQERTPSYKGCSASENFRNFQWFADWCNKQVGFGESGYELDKDILYRGNKVYSESTCVFVPKRLNTLLVNCNYDKRNLPMGVYMDNRDVTVKYMALCRDGYGKKVNLGRYSTPDEAYAAYKEYKKGICRILADKFTGKVDARVIDALYNYEG